MKIVYVLPPNSTNFNNGIKQQALIWKDILKDRGVEIIEFNPWDKIKWEEIELIHIFGSGLWLIDVVNQFKTLEIPIILSPIFDSSKPIWQYKFASLMGCKRLRLFSQFNVLRTLKEDITAFLVRSRYEYDYLHKAFGVPENKIKLLRLPNRLSNLSEENIVTDRKDYCLHVSVFTQTRKNVMSLVKAAIKYNFNLKIAGYGGTDQEIKPFKDIADKHPNIKLLGPVSEDQLLTLYREAKVFALPSFDEGVGFVALEAASQGCNIVITDVGGPKEYYDGMAITVNPHDIDDIGKAVIQSLAQPTDPLLARHIRNEYSLKKNGENLKKIYLDILKSHK